MQSDGEIQYNKSGTGTVQCSTSRASGEIAQREQSQVNIDSRRNSLCAQLPSCPQESKHSLTAPRHPT